MNCVDVFDFEPSHDTASEIEEQIKIEKRRIEQAQVEIFDAEAELKRLRAQRALRVMRWGR